MKWYAKAFSKTTGVSVRTLHHYDEIALLKPSLRLPNGYRLYSEADLLKLQQILALKFFGFELSEIKDLMQKPVDTLDHLYAQKKFLESQISQFQAATQILNEVINDVEKGSLNMVSIVKLIEEYQMNKKLKDLSYEIDSPKQRQYEQYLVERGTLKQSQVEDYRKKAKGKPKEEMEAWKKQGEAFHLAMSAAIDKGLMPDDPEVQRLMHDHYKLICLWWVPTQETYIGLSDLYLDHPDWQTFFGAFHPKLQHFLSEAMKIFAKRELS